MYWLTWFKVSGHRHALVAFGDSFVGPLTLLKHRRVYVKKFSGASAKVRTNPLYWAYELNQFVCIGAQQQKLALPNWGAGHSTIGLS